MSTELKGSFFFGLLILKAVLFLTKTQNGFCSRIRHFFLAKIKNNKM